VDAPDIGDIGEFSFDVGATTLVDFEPGGVGGELLDAVGLSPIRGEQLPGYEAWLPDRRLTLHRDPTAWQPRTVAGLRRRLRPPCAVAAHGPARGRVLASEQIGYPDADAEASRPGP
jgi:hypothetical protein